MPADRQCRHRLGGLKEEWAAWEARSGAKGVKGRAVAVRQRFARKRPTLQVLARHRRERAKRVKKELALARRKTGQKGPAIRYASRNSILSYRVIAN